MKNSRNRSAKVYEIYAGYKYLFFLIKRRPESVIHKFMEHEPGDIAISSIIYAELAHGVEKSTAKERNRIALTMFLSEIPVIPFDDLAVQEYGIIKAELQKRGTPIGPMGTLIAAHAKSLGLILVTNNTREFARINGLSLEDWV